MLSDLKISLLEDHETIMTGKKALEVLAPVHAVLGAHMVSLIKRIEADITGIEEAVSKTSNEKNSEIRAEKDRVRDDAFNAFKTFIEANGKRPLPAGASEALKKTKAAALEIEKVIRKHDWSLQDLSYDKQSATFAQLKTELDQPEYKGYLTLLTAGPWFDAVCAAEDDFQAASSQSLDSKNMQKNTPVPGKIYKKLTKHLPLLFDNLDFIKEEEPGKIDEQYNKIDILTQDVMSVAYARQTRKKNQDNPD